MALAPFLAALAFRNDRVLILELQAMKASPSRSGSWVSCVTITPTPIKGPPKISLLPAAWRCWWEAIYSRILVVI